MADSGEGGSGGRGIVFVATGEQYRALLPVAAAYARRNCPKVGIEAFTDAPVESPDIDHQTILTDIWRRSKIDVLPRTRFDRALYLDVDALVIADLTDGFDLLERFDLAMTHDQDRNGKFARTQVGNPLPSAFPMFNGGAIFYRRNAATEAFFRTWAERVRARDTSRDQPDLRLLSWETDCRIATLPYEYNVLNVQTIRFVKWTAAPRVIHSPHFHRNARFSQVRHPVLLLLGPGRYSDLLHWLSRDQTLPTPRLAERDRSALARIRRFVVLRLLYLHMKLGGKPADWLQKLLPADGSLF